MQLSTHKTKLMALGLIATGVIAFGAQSYTAFAQEAQDNGQTFIERLASKLGIGTDELQTAVDEVRDEVHDEHMADAVTSGDLTQEQADLLDQIRAYRDAHRAEEEAFREQLRDTNFAERRDLIEQHREEENQAMADELGVSVDEITAVLEAGRGQMPGGPRGGRAMGGRMGGGMMDGFGGGGFGPGEEL